MTNIVPSPFQAGSQELIAKLIRAGYLQPTQSHDAAVVASAIARETTRGLLTRRKRSVSDKSILP